jgi:hypothetical protein
MIRAPDTMCGRVARLGVATMWFNFTVDEGLIGFKKSAIQLI